MFKQAIVALLLSSAVAKKADMISANTPKGRALLKHATVVKPSEHIRRVQDNEYYQNYQYNANGEQQWNQYQNEGQYELDLARLSLKYLGCSEWSGVDYEWQQEQAEQQMQNYYQNQQQQNQGQQGEDGQYQQYQQQQQQQQEYYQAYNDGLVKQSLVRFTLCTEGCGSCSGEYAVDMLEFIDAYTESKMTTLEYQCEMIRDRCYCQNGNWEQCFYDCYEQAEFDLYGSDAGVQYCLQEYYGQEQFEVQRYLECAEVEQYENNNNGQNQQYNGYNYGNGNGQGQNANYNYQGQEGQGEDVQYYIGPYCSDNKYIFLGAFYDEDCTYKATNAKFQGQNYGSSFPYFKESMIEPNECISCQETESYYEMKQAYKQNQYYAQNANNQNYGYNGQAEYNYAWDYDMDYGDATEVCNTGVEDAIKCDKNRGYYSGCEFIDSTLPSLDGRANSVSATSADVYDKLKRNKNSAIVMGVIAAVLLGALAFMCGLCGGGGDPKKIALLEKKRMGEEEGQLA